MIVTETRIVRQEWYETELTKTGWDSHGWVFQDDGQLMPNEWTVINHLQSDKFYNPMLGIAEKKTEVA